MYALRNSRSHNEIKTRRNQGLEYKIHIMKNELNPCPFCGYMGIVLVNLEKTNMRSVIDDLFEGFVKSQKTKKSDINRTLFYACRKCKAHVSCSLYRPKKSSLTYIIK